MLAMAYVCMNVCTYVPIVISTAAYSDYYPLLCSMLFQYFLNPIIIVVRPYYVVRSAMMRRVNKTINSSALVGRRGDVSVAFSKIVSPESREIYTIREWRDVSGTYSIGLPLISPALARRDRL